MKPMTAAALLLSSLVVPAAAIAQDDTPAAQYAYATYYVCSPDGESRADEIIDTSFRPHYDAAVEQGDIVGWSWMQHYVGGIWRRVLVIIAADMDSMLDASGALGEIITESTPEAGRAFSSICSSHEDYIWEAVDGIGNGNVSQDRGSAGYTMYLQCDMRREDRADQLVREVFAPIYDRHVTDGELSSWNWLRHYIGGKYRRILTLGAADHKTLMRARAAVLDEFDGGRAIKRAVDEMNEICFEHTDYLWDILIQNP